MQEQQRFIFRTDGQVEICPGDGSNRDPGDIRNPKPMRGTYYWQQRGEAIYIHGILPAQHYPENVALGPDIKIEYIGLIADKPLRIGVHEGIHLRGVVRNLYGPTAPWFAFKRPQPTGPGQ